MASDPPTPLPDDSPVPNQADPSLPRDDPNETLLLDDLRVVLTRRTQAITSPDGITDELEGRHVGRYLVNRLLGEGGMARVYEATDTAFGRDEQGSQVAGDVARVYEATDTSTAARVAFKILKPQYRADPGICARFEREARSMARIHHDHVVRIFDFLSVEQMSAIVMEFLPGGSLRDRLNPTRMPRQDLEIEDAVSLIAQAAAGVEAAHNIGVIHRDVKPSNLLLDANGQVKVADFGTIMVVEGTTWLTGIGQQIGTPGYMSPEQCKGDRLTPASDVYSLGVTLFELLTGRLPFEVEEDSPFAIMLKHISEPPPDPCLWRGGISQGLATVILKSLAKNPADRYATAGEFANALLKEPAGPHPPEVHEAEKERGLRVDVAAVRKQLLLLPQRAIVCWACRCARRVQNLNPDPRVERALAMAESTVTESAETGSPSSVSRALSRIRALRAASLKAAYTHEEGRAANAAVEAARSAAAAAASAAALCIDDTAADAAFAARSAITALRLAGRPIKPWWDAARNDYLKLANAKLGQEGTLGQAIPASFFDDGPHLSQGHGPI